jgi:hypothetical protein
MTNPELLIDIVRAVKRKQEYIYLDERFIIREAQEYFRLHPDKAEGIERLQTQDKHQRSAAYKDLIKHIRARARNIYGIYQQDTRSRDRLLGEGDIDGLLQTHLSTKERLPYYDALYKSLATMVKMESITDLGCGLNPLSIIYMEQQPKHYIAVEPSAEDAHFLNRFFKQQKLRGTAYAIDLVREKERIMTLPKTTTAFLFKLLDVLEKQERHMTYSLLPKIQAESLVVSFTSVNVRQAPLERPRRSWFEKVCKRTGFSYDVFELGNEIFYVCCRDA